MAKAKLRDVRVTSDEAEKALGLSKGSLLTNKNWLIPHEISPDGKRWVWSSDVIVALKLPDAGVMNAKLELAAMSRGS